MRTVIVALVALVLGGAAVYYGTQQSTISLPDVTAEQVSKDLMGKSVVLGTGQLWGFSPDQKVEVQVLSKKAQDQNMIVAVKLKAVAKLEPLNEHKEPDKPKIEGSTPAQPPVKPTSTEAEKPKEKEIVPKRATLDGLVKLYYENVSGQWYLVHVESVQLNVTAE